MITFQRLGTRIIYASRSGVPLAASSSNVASMPDASAALQRLLDLAQGGPTRLILDGWARLQTPLRVRTGTEFAGLPGSGLWCGNGLNGPAVRNQNWRSSYNGGSPVYDGSTIVDRDIRLSGLTIQGNRGNGTNGCCTGGNPRLAGVAANGIGLNQYVSPLQFFGVKDLSIEGCTILDPAAYGIHLANVFRVGLHGITVIDPDPQNVDAGHGTRNTDSIHFNGPADDIDGSGWTLQSGDDPIALNADDGNLDGTTAPGSGAAAFGGFSTVYKGPITRVSIRGVRVSRSLDVLRILSGTSRIDGITISDVSGDVYARGILGDIFPGVPGPGNVGRVTLRDWSIRQTSGGEFILIGGTWDRLAISNLSRVAATGDFISPIDVTANIKELEISGLSLIDGSGSVIQGPLIDLKGTVASARIGGALTRPGLSGDTGQPFVRVSSGSVGSVHLNGILSHGSAKLLHHTGGTLMTVRATGCDYAGTGAAITTTGTITNVASNNAGNVGITTSGTITNAG